MGFWGTMIVARTDRSLAMLPAVQALGGEPDTEHEGAGGWRFWRAYRADGPENFEDLVAQVGGPVLAAYVLDSDIAIVVAGAPGQEPFDFSLNGAQGYFDDYPPGERPPSTEDPAVNAAAPARILAWAGGGDLDAITAAVEGKLLFAEDAVLRLAAAFGAIPDGELEEWVFGPLEEYRPE